MNAFNTDRGLIRIRISGVAASGKTIARKAIEQPLRDAGFTVLAVTDPRGITEREWRTAEELSMTTHVAIVEDIYQEAVDLTDLGQ